MSPGGGTPPAVTAPDGLTVRPPQGEPAVVLGPGPHVPPQRLARGSQGDGALGPGPAEMVRTERVTPSMSGSPTLVIGRIGDWTWDAVSRVCGLDVLRASTASGRPAYLSFTYFRVRASPGLHLLTPGFGDHLRVRSAVYDAGDTSVLVVHRIHRTPADEPGEPDAGARASAGACLEVETLNHWITRSDERSNRALVRSAPVGFRREHLPPPDRPSPRLACRRARSELTFAEPSVREGARRGPSLRLEYRVDLARDLNAVGLLYFATYWSIVDRALLGLWRALGRSVDSFLERIVVDQQLCIAGNADADCIMDVLVERFRLGNEATDLVDVVLRDREGDRLLAVCTLRVLDPSGLPAGVGPGPA